MDNGHGDSSVMCAHLCKAAAPFLTELGQTPWSIQARSWTPNSGVAWAQAQEATVQYITTSTAISPNPSPKALPGAHLLREECAFHSTDIGLDAMTPLGEWNGS